MTRGDTMIADTYQGLEPIHPMSTAGTEELGFFSETETYNRDDEPCTNFSIAEEFVRNIDKAIAKLMRFK